MGGEAEDWFQKIFMLISVQTFFLTSRALIFFKLNFELWKAYVDKVMTE